MLSAFFLKLMDAILETLAVYRSAAKLWIALNEAVKIHLFIDGREVDMAETLILKDSQKVSASVEFKTAAGNPAVVEGAPVWASSNAAIVEVVASEDGLSAVARAVGPIGSSQISVSADADLGEGVKPIVGTQDIEVVAGEAVTVGITVGTPEEQ